MRAILYALAAALLLTACGAPRFGPRDQNSTNRPPTLQEESSPDPGYWDTQTTGGNPVMTVPLENTSSGGGDDDDGDEGDED